MMNKKIIVGISGFIISLILFTLLFSCEKETIVRDAEYPGQSIYLPAAYPDGQFVIDDITRKRGEQPIDGYLYRYLVDLGSNQFVVPLSVYRAGVNNDGNFTVNIKMNNDTITELNESRDLSDVLHIIPQDKYSIVNSVEMPNGEEVSPFELKIDLDYLLDHYPDKLFALAVEISSAEREVSPDLSTVVVIIDTKIMKPTADFTTSSDGKNVSFTNNSQMAGSYIWDFGDGYFSDAPSPTHTYAQSGDYNVSLTAIGITGNKDRSVQSTEFTIY